MKAESQRIGLTHLLRVSTSLSLLAAACWLTGCQTGERLEVVSKWARFEHAFTSVVAYDNPFQDAELQITFVSPSGEKRVVPGFWDGGQTWRVRFAPDQIGRWTYRTACSKTTDIGLHDLSGGFVCTAPTGKTRFGRHGPVKVSRDHRSLVHDDWTPFFWLGDTAWNGPLLSTDADWAMYVRERGRQGFSAVQWVTTQWRAAPEGDLAKRLAYTGKERIAISPEFFQRLDRKVEDMNAAGLLSVPVLLWAINGGSNPQVNPGVSLPVDQAIRLARHMVARWQGDNVIWILNGDGDYRGANAQRWKEIGRGVFGNIHHAPVTLHPGGRMWVLDEFRNEPWLDLCGYQSGHNNKNDNLAWITSGPPATEWQQPPTRPFISLEAPYENHNGSEGAPMTPFVVRRAHYWSLLNAPTAGVTYGGHGIWGWDDGTQPPVDHPGTGVPRPWHQALFMDGARQMSHLQRFFSGIEFFKLRPAPEALVNQPGVQDVRRFVAVSRAADRSLLVAYVPADRAIELRAEALPKNFVASWNCTEKGARFEAKPSTRGETVRFETPGEGDWLLIVRTARK